MSARSLTVPFLTAVLSSCLAAAQQPASPPPPQDPYRIRVERQLVLVDVVVRDKQGNSVEGLTAQDFQLTEDGKAQAIAFFEPVTPASRPPRLAEDSGSIVVLLDRLNSSFVDAVYARQAVQRIIEQLAPGEKVAIYGLGRDLVLLHGFTSDRAALLRAIDLRNISEGRQMPESNPELEHIRLVAAEDPDVVPVLATLERFEMEIAHDLLARRIESTSAALRSLARTLRSIPGRKSLVWLTGSFPQFHGQQRRVLNFSDALHAAASDLNDAQVSVYAVHTGGVGGRQIGDLAEAPVRNPGVRDPGATVRTASEMARQSGDSVGTLKDLALWTGGQAFYNRNDLEVAYQAAVRDNGAYYTLAYSPTNRNLDAHYRRIKVTSARKGVSLRHRMGYYAVAPEHRRQLAERDLREAILVNPVTLSEVRFAARLLPPAGQGSWRVRYEVPARLLDAEERLRAGKPVVLDFAVATFRAGGGVGQSGGLAGIAFQPADPSSAVLTQELELREPPTPGQRMRVLVRDADTGSIGTFDLTVP